MKILLSLLSIFIISPTLAEYRVYQYLIKNQIETPDQKPGIIVESTMDPVAYTAYHGGSELVSISLLRTWMCAGFTGKKKDLCNSPYNNLPPEVLP